MGTLWALIGADDWRIRNIWQLDAGLDLLEAGLSANPLVASLIIVEAVGSKRIAEGAYRPPLIIVTSGRPEQGISVRLMCTQVNNTTGLEVVVDGVEKELETKTCISGHSLHLQVGVESVQLEQESSSGDFFPLIGSHQIIQ
jgi:hypothetical protein